MYELLVFQILTSAAMGTTSAREMLTVSTALAATAVNVLLALNYHPTVPVLVRNQRLSSPAFTSPVVCMCSSQHPLFSVTLCILLFCFIATFLSKSKDSMIFLKDMFWVSAKS